MIQVPMEELACNAEHELAIHGVVHFRPVEYTLTQSPFLRVIIELNFTIYYYLRPQ